MKRREFLKNSAFGAAAVTISPALNWSCGRQRGKTNILILFTDDQRFNTIHALNNPEISTPNMDRLVEKGVTFTRAYIMGGTSGAVCMPSRAMLLTGRTLFHLQNRGATIPKNHLMLPELARQYGYHTFGIGKWHNGRAAFARAFSGGGKIFFGGMSNHLRVPVYDFDPQGNYPKENQYLGTKFSTELFTDQAIQFLRRHPVDRPFFLYLSYTAPHDPRMAPEKFADMYDPARISLPHNFMPRHPFDNGEMNVRDEKLAPWPRSPEVIRQHIADYYAMITHLDYHIGRILDTLDEIHASSHTLIIFAGDNGLALGQHGLMGKQNLYDHSVRIPLIFSGPGIPENVQSKTLCYLLDIYPTVCELIGMPLPESVEGKSLVPAIRNPDKKIRSTVFLAYTKLQRGIRTDDDWKLIKYNVRGVQHTQLFNLEQDPWELENLSGRPEFADRERQLEKSLRKSMRELDDFCNLDQPNWGLPEEKYGISKVNHLAVRKKIHITNQAVIQYNPDGVAALIDGIRGTSSFKDGHWCGVEGDDLEVVIDLEAPRLLTTVTVGCLQDQAAWIFFPRAVLVALSRDGRSFLNQTSEILPEIVPDRFRRIKEVTVHLPEERARYVKVLVEGIKICPSWHPGSGRKAWIFVDEFMVE